MKNILISLLAISLTNQCFAQKTTPPPSNSLCPALQAFNGE
jgi:hypothetical protein